MFILSIEIRITAGIVNKKFMIKQVWGFDTERITPAAAGPINLAILKHAELSAMALLKSFLSSTRFAKIDCRKGVSIAIVQFSIKPKIIIVNIFNKLHVETIIRHNAWIKNKICVATISCFLLYLSVITPEIGVRINNGIALQNIILPIRNGDFVISNNIQLIAIF